MHLERGQVVLDRDNLGRTDLSRYDYRMSKVFPDPQERRAFQIGMRDAIGQLQYAKERETWCRILNERLIWELGVEV